MSDPKPASPSPSKGFGVAASPFNGVKVELGIILILGFILWLAADSITGSITAQLMLLVGYGLVGALWLIIRTRKVVQQLTKQEASPETNQKMADKTSET